MGLFEKLGESLKKTRDNVFGSLSEMIRGSEITDEMYEELEERLIMADTGADMAVKLVDTQVNEQHLKTGGQALDALKSIIKAQIAAQSEMHMDGHPAVILIIGVNGVGKTTSIAKLANYYKQQGKSVLL
ncbi:MAG: signal recognition particle receptor subunit alpha, partial [Ruthenibacterium sp.]